jgi:transcriptional regulator with XRE-family HTH domain
MAKTLAERFTWLRAFKGLSLQECAARVGCHFSYLSRLESGKAVPSARFIARLAVGLRVNAPWLTSGEGDPFYSVEDARTERALPEWPKTRVARVLAVLDDLPDALAAGAVVGRLVKGLGLEELKALAAEIRALPDLPVPARLFWNQLFTDLQLAKLDAWHREKMGLAGDQAEAAVAGEKTHLPDVVPSENISGVKTVMPDLLRRLNRAHRPAW